MTTSMLINESSSSQQFLIKYSIHAFSNNMAQENHSKSVDTLIQARLHLNSITAINMSTRDLEKALKV